MNRFLDETLPKALIEVQATRDTLEREKWALALKLDADDEWEGHICDCDRCPSQDYEPLTDGEVEELETQLDEHDTAIKALDHEIRTMTTYKEWMEKVT